MKRFGAHDRERKGASELGKIPGKIVKYCQKFQTFVSVSIFKKKKKLDSFL